MTRLNEEIVVNIESTLSMAFRKARQTNATDNGFPARVPTKTAPTGKGDNVAQATASAVFNLAGTPSVDGRVETESWHNRIIVVPFGVGSDTNTFSVRVIGWRRAYERDSDMRDDTALWVPVTLAEFSVALSTPTGAAGSVIGVTNLFADTITLTGTSGNDDIDISITSPADNTIAHAVIDLKGFQKVELTFTTGGSATSCNALVAYY